MDYVTNNIFNSSQNYMCFKCKIEFSFDEIKYCISNSCKKYLCVDCRDKHQKLLKHQAIDLKEYKSFSFFINYKQNTSHYEKIVDYNSEMDNKNKLLFADVKAEKKIKTGRKWDSIGIQEDQVSYIVSFVGSSGSGKSTIIGLLCKEGNHPIPGDSSSLQSTSTGINSFIGETVGKEIKFLILDSEGVGGTSTTVIGCVEDNLTEEEKEIKNQIVGTTYPRLLYVSSDVFVLTFCGQVQNRESIIKSLTEFTNVSSQNYNNSYFPHLIILMNRSNLPQEYDDPETAKKKYFEEESIGTENVLDFLQFRFTSVSLLFLPEFDYSFERFKNQFGRLEKLISEKLLETMEHKKANIVNGNKNGLASGKSLKMEKMSRAIDFYNTNRSGILDVKSLESHHTNIYSEDVLPLISDICFGLFLDFTLISIKSKGKDGFIKGLEAIKSRLQVFVEFTLKNLNGPNLIFEMFSKELFSVELGLLANLPCNFSKDGSECLNTLSSHILHQVIPNHLKNACHSNLFKEFCMEMIPGKYDEWSEGIKMINLSKHFKGISSVALPSDLPKHYNFENSKIIKISYCENCNFFISSIGYTCEHVVCVYCSSKSNHNACPISNCGKGKLKKELKLLNVTKTMRPRILLIDGLKKIEDINQTLVNYQNNVYGIRLCNLFDHVYTNSLFISRFSNILLKDMGKELTSKSLIDIQSKVEILPVYLMVYSFDKFDYSMIIVGDKEPIPNAQIIISTLFYLDTDYKFNGSSFIGSIKCRLQFNEIPDQIKDQLKQKHCFSSNGKSTTENNSMDFLLSPEQSFIGESFSIPFSISSPGPNLEIYCFIPLLNSDTNEICQISGSPFSMHHLLTFEKTIKTGFKKV